MVDADGRDQPDRRVAAPDLRETADIWFDTGRDPVVTWDPAGTHFELLDPGQPTSRITLLRVGRPAADPAAVATALAEGLAACDFPPTADEASPENVARTLRAAGFDPQQL